MSLAALAALKPLSLDVFQEDPETGEPLLMRLFYKRISSLEAAKHGMTRSQIIAELGRDARRHRDPKPKRDLDKADALLRGVTSDLSVYEPDDVQAARIWREQVVQIDARLAQWPAEVLSEALTAATPGTAAEGVESPGLRQAIADRAALEQARPVPALLRLLAREEKTAQERAVAMESLLQHEQGRLSGLARKLGSSGAAKSMQEREAMICAGVVAIQTLKPNPNYDPDYDASKDAGTDAAQLDRKSEWLPAKGEERPIPVQIDRTVEHADLTASPAVYPIRIFGVDVINELSELIFQASINGGQGRAALERFRRRSAVPEDAGSNRTEPGEIRP